MGWRMCQCLSEMVLAGKTLLLASGGAFPSPLGRPGPPRRAGESVVP